jgi:uncharacterized protein (DUF305 family)
MDHSKMDHGNGHSMNSSADAESAPYELQFLDTMIVHHQGAVDMALLADTRAEHHELKTLAKNIIEDQRREIDKMREWRSQLFDGLAPAVNMKLPGMAEGMQAMDMAKLDRLNHHEFDLEFIRQMVPHHEGAVVMAKTLREQATRPELKEFAVSIMKAQADEISQMRQWQDAWSK